MNDEALIEHVENFKNRGFNQLTNLNDTYYLLVKLDKKYDQVTLAEISTDEKQPRTFVLDKKELEDILSMFN